MRPRKRSSACEVRGGARFRGRRQLVDSVLDVVDADQVALTHRQANDVEPGLALGMRVICIAIEEPPPPASAAHAVATSLREAGAILRTWA